MAIGINNPNLSLNLPGILSDYSSLGGYGSSDYSPVTDYSLKATPLAAQVSTGNVGAVSGSGSSWWDSLLGGKNADGTSSNGWGGMALGLAQGLSNAYMGMQQYGLAKDQLKFSKDAFEKNYAAQRSMTNASLADRQRARVASNAGAYQSVGDYMAENGIK